MCIICIHVLNCILGNHRNVLYFFCDLELNLIVLNFVRIIQFVKCECISKLHYCSIVVYVELHFVAKKLNTCNCMDFILSKKYMHVRSSPFLTMAIVW